MAEEAQHRRQAIDGGYKLGRRAALGRGQRRAHVQKMAQHGKLKVWRALGHDAVMQDVALHEPGEPRQVLIEAPLEVFALAHEGQVGEHHRLQPGDGLMADQASAQRAFEMPALAGQREDEAGGEARIGGARQPLVVADPRNDSLGQHVAAPGDGRPAPLAFDPVVDQAGGEHGSAGIAAVAQVAQPAKTVQQVEPECGRAGALPWRVIGRGRHGARAATGQKLAGKQALAADRVAGPGVGRHGKEAFGGAEAQGQGIEAGTEQPAAEFTAFVGRAALGMFQGPSGRRGPEGAGAGHQRLTGPSHV